MESNLKAVELYHAITGEFIDTSCDIDELLLDATGKDYSELLSEAGSYRDAKSYGRSLYLQRHARITINWDD